MMKKYNISNVVCLNMLWSFLHIYKLANLKQNSNLLQLLYLIAMIQCMTHLH